LLTLEGGYDLEALARSVRGCVQVLAGDTPPPLKGSATRSAAALHKIISAQRSHWQF